MEKVIIDFAKLTGNGEVRNLSGKERGVAARAELGLDNYDASENEVLVKVPSYVDTISPSYFQGLFSESIKKLNKDGFSKKYKFDASDIIMNWIDIGIRNTTISRAPLI
ncbi:hypothetical protein ACLBWZ_16480 [Brucellaceae bacterium C25G]